MQALQETIRPSADFYRKRFVLPQIYEITTAKFPNAAAKKKKR